MKNNITMNIKWKEFKNNCSYSLLFLFFMAAISASAQTKTVSGVTKDSDGMVLPGVNIVVKGTNTGAISDFDGNYSIKMNANTGTLVFSYLGFKTAEIAVKGQTTVNVNLVSDTQQLDDVVIIGYGSQKKATVVGAVTQAKGEDLLRAGSVTTISEALTGLMPGVTTMQAAGQPGSTAASVLIRGRSSWTNSAPLYMVDGVERDFNTLDPNEVESISVLKDASATAVYGVKAANGVILITTKSGSIGEPKIQFTANAGMKNPTIETDYVADYATNLEYYNLALKNDGKYDKLIPQFYIDRWRDPAYADNPYYQYTSFINSLLKTGYTQQYNLSISGGDKFVKYFTSFGYNYDGDIFDLKKQPEFDPRTYERRFTYRTNLDFTLTKSTQFSVKLSGDMTNWNGNFATKNTNGGVSNTGGDIMQRIFSTASINTPALYQYGRLGYDYNNNKKIN